MPNDPFITEMNPFLKQWMIQNWFEDQIERRELAKNHAYLIGSFWNSEAVQKLINSENNRVSVTDEEFEIATKQIEQELQPEKQRRRKRKQLRDFNG